MVPVQAGAKYAGDVGPGVHHPSTLVAGALHEYSTTPTACLGRSRLRLAQLLKQLRVICILLHDCGCVARAIESP